MNKELILSAFFTIAGLWYSVVSVLRILDGINLAWILLISSMACFLTNGYIFLNTLKLKK